MYSRKQQPNTRRIMAVLAAWVLAVWLVPITNAAPAADPAPLTDLQISDAVEDELIYEQPVPANLVDVTVDNGVVTLTGDVYSLMAKKRAERVAETVKGVTAVINDIRVLPPADRTDREIENDAEDALLYDQATESWQISVDVEDNTATLTGTVDSWAERQLAEKTVASVSGVTNVKNDLQVEYETNRSDQAIQADVEERLSWDILVDDALVDVKVKNGKVTLSGTVGSAAEKTEAITDAWVAGVKSVNADKLDVARWARDPDLRADKYADRSDAEITEAVNNALLVDPRVKSFNVDVSAEDGFVTLRGKVDNLKAKRAASEVARGTVGVLGITNRIKVRPTDELTDEQIARNVRQAFLRDPYVEEFAIDVSVDNGVVRLSGNVDTYFERSHADDVASRAEGVESVRNGLIVAETGYPLTYDPYVSDYYPYDYEWYDYEPGYTFKTDEQLENNINDQMFWSPFVDADQVNVAVDDGVAHLTGTVDTWSEYYSARENAYEGGATWVDNDLVVD